MCVGGRRPKHISSENQLTLIQNRTSYPFGFFFLYDMGKVTWKSQYAQVPNLLLNDKRLTLKAKGLFGLMQSKSDDWNFSVSGLASICKESKDAISGAVQELEDYGWMQRVKYQDSKGHWDIEYKLFESPINVLPIKENPMTENPTTGNPLTENHINIVKKEKVNKDKERKTNLSICENSKNEFSPSEQSNNLLDVSLNEKKEKKNEKAQKPKSCDGDEPKSYDPSNYVDGIGDGELRDLVGVFYKKNPDKYETVMYKEFLAYWTELPIAGKNKKERWRHQKFFNLSGRLATWAGNFKKAFPAKQFTQSVDHIQKRCIEADNYDF